MKLCNLFRNDAGFTLMTLIIGMALMALVMAGVLSVLVSSLNAHNYVMGANNNIAQARQALTTMVNEIRFAKSVTRPAAAATSLAYVDSEGNNCMLSYNSGDRKVYLKRGSAAAAAITAGIVTGLRFDPEADDVNTVTITIRAQDAQGGNPFQTQSKVRLLNPS